jgi:predicted MFS family arabinose efflux permease
MGQFLFGLTGGALISAFGWYEALLILAAATLLIIVCAIPLLAQNTRTSALPAGEREMTLREAIGKAFGNTSYLLLTAGFFVCGFQLAFITIHLPPYLAENGISTGIAAIAISAIGFFNVAGSYVSGIIGGRYQRRLPLSLIYLLRSAAIAAFILVPLTGATTLVFAAVMGLLWLSTVPLTMGLVTVFFGTRYMATLYGFVFLSHQVGSFFGVWLGGILYDRLGSYGPVWWMGAALGVFAAIVHLPIREQRSRPFTEPSPA